MKRLLRLPDVKKATGMARSTIYKKMAENDFPKSITLGAKYTAWLESDIEHWINEKIEAANNNGVSLHEE